MKELVGYYLKYLEGDFSLTVVDDKKASICKWTELQTKKLNKDEFTNIYSSQKARGAALITGYDNLEVVDVDLKVFSTTPEKEEFWNTLLSLLREAIYDFDKIFSIYKTKNAGYHILYKTKRCQPSQKLAKLENHTQAVIETKGKKGYVIMYPDGCVNGIEYKDIQYINDKDWNSLMLICKSFDYIIEDNIIVQPKQTKTHNNGITPLDDFNSQNKVWDVINEEFTIVKNLSDRLVLKRIGSENFLSGSIFKESDLLYLFTTSTIYPAEKGLSAAAAYAYKYHNGDFNKAAKDLYNQGFGSRLEKEYKEKEKIIINENIDYEYNNEDIIFPIDVFPLQFKNFILQCNERLDTVIDYAGCSLLWAVSLIIGNSLQVKVKNGWYELPVVWFSLVGNPGIGKTPSIRLMLAPLIKENNKKIKEYIERKKEYDAYEKLSKAEKEKHIDVEPPSKKQNIVDDITMEALIDLHENVPHGIGIFKDELAGWLKDMNKYRSGSDLEAWLSSWSGSSININRMTRPGSFVEKPFMPVIGGIQPGILNTLYSEDKKDNGFMDRMLISFPENIVPLYNDKEIDYDVLKWYDMAIKKTILLIEQIDDDRNKVVFSTNAKKMWIDKFNEISNKQNSENENEYFKSMYPKQKSYIPRFALILNVLFCTIDDKYSIDVICDKAMEGAIKLSDYFVAHAKKIKFEKKVTEDMENVTNNHNSIYEKVKAAYNNDNNFNRSKLADLLSVSRITIIRYVNEIKDAHEGKY
jgi:hypothetical protein